MGSGDAKPAPLYGCLYRLAFEVCDSSGLRSGALGLEATRSLDGAAQGACTNTPTEAGTSGTYYLDLTAAEMQASLVAVMFTTTSAGCFASPRYITPYRLPSVRTGTAQLTGGSTTTLKADAGASVYDNFYAGCYLVIDDGTACPKEARRIQSSSGTTKILTVAPAFSADPTVGGTITPAFTILQAPGVARDAVALSALDAAASAAVILADPTHPLATDSSGRAQADLAAILGTALPAEGAGETGWYAAALGKFLKIGTPANTLNDLATSANQTTILARLGAWTGTGVNSILGAIRALFRSDADVTVPSDINADLGAGAGTANNTTDSVEALRDRGDSVWVTATGFAVPGSEMTLTSAYDAAKTAAQAGDAMALTGAERTSLLLALFSKTPADYETTLGKLTLPWVMAWLSGSHKITATDNGDGTSSMQLYKSDGTTAWGTPVLVGTSALANAITDVRDTA